MYLCNTHRPKAAAVIEMMQQKHATMSAFAVAYFPRGFIDVAIGYPNGGHTHWKVAKSKGRETSTWVYCTRMSSASSLPFKVIFPCFTLEAVEGEGFPADDDGNILDIIQGFERKLETDKPESQMSGDGCCLPHLH